MDFSIDGRLTPGWATWSMPPRLTKVKRSLISKTTVNTKKMVCYERVLRMTFAMAGLTVGVNTTISVPTFTVSFSPPGGKTSTVIANTSGRTSLALTFRTTCLNKSTLKSPVKLETNVLIAKLVKVKTTTRWAENYPETRSENGSITLTTSTHFAMSYRSALALIEKISLSAGSVTPREALSSTLMNVLTSTDDTVSYGWLILITVAPTCTLVPLKKTLFSNA